MAAPTTDGVSVLEQAKSIGREFSELIKKAHAKSLAPEALVTEAMEHVKQFYQLEFTRPDCWPSIANNVLASLVEKCQFLCLAIKSDEITVKMLTLLSELAMGSLPRYNALRLDMLASLHNHLHTGSPFGSGPSYTFAFTTDLLKATKNIRKHTLYAYIRACADVKEPARVSEDLLSLAKYAALQHAATDAKNSEKDKCTAFLALVEGRLGNTTAAQRLFGSIQHVVPLEYGTFLYECMKDTDHAIWQWMGAGFDGFCEIRDLMIKRPELKMGHERYLLHIVDNFLVWAVKAAILQKDIHALAQEDTQLLEKPVFDGLTEEKELGYKQYFHLPRECILDYRDEIAKKLPGTQVIISRCAPGDRYERPSLYRLGLVLQVAKDSNQHLVDWCNEFALKTGYYEGDTERDLCLLAIKNSPNRQYVHEDLCSHFSGFLSRTYDKIIEPVLGPRLPKALPYDSLPARALSGMAANLGVMLTTRDPVKEREAAHNLSFFADTL